MKKHTYLMIKMLVSLGLMAFILARADLFLLTSSILRAKLYFIFIAIACAYIAYALNTYKWQQLLKRLDSYISYLELLRLNFIGLFYALFLPTQISGEIVKGIRLSRSEKNVPNSNIVASIVVDRTTGLLALTILFFISLNFASPLINKVRFSLSALFLFGLILISAVAVLNNQVSDMLERFGQTIFKTKGLKKLKEPVSFLWGSLKAYQNSRLGLGEAVVYSFIYQLLVTGTTYFAAYALGIKVSFIGLVWIVAVISIAQLLPISISGIGVREGIFVFLLKEYHVTSQEALALSLIIFGISILMGITGGVMDIFKLK
ncbi:MAG: lysylphosphatidylglycerol synthase transmembrane domain-containing protein [bacterium]|nr:lysylphosphatidylglycerol synthase transmembrane domain-containing protein [bacterium]